VPRLSARSMIKVFVANFQASHVAADCDVLVFVMLELISRNVLCVTRSDDASVATGSSCQSPPVTHRPEPLAPDRYPPFHCGTLRCSSHQSSLNTSFIDDDHVIRTGSPCSAFRNTIHQSCSLSCSFLSQSSLTDAARSIHHTPTHDFHVGCITWFVIRVGGQIYRHARGRVAIA